jgi:hypothetical protein
MPVTRVAAPGASGSHSDSDEKLQFFWAIRRIAEISGSFLTLI